MNDSIKLHIPSNNIPERLYAVEVLFKELLNVSYIVVEEEKQTESLLIDVCGRVIAFEDHFFGEHIEPMRYLSQDYIPQTIKKLSSFKEFDVPIIYGQDKYAVENGKIRFGLDIIASVFFMLTRWEEYVLGRESTGKCNEDDLLCVKMGNEKIPIVHVYEDFLKHILHEVGFEVQNQRRFSFKTTHDVDRCFLTSWKELFNNARKIYSNGNKKQAWKIVKDYLWYKTHFKNPFDTYDFFMNCAELAGIKDEFYFKCCEGDEQGKTYSIKDKEVQFFIQHINERQHKVGFHPSESTFNNNEQFLIEFNRLKSVNNDVTVCGRNHGLFCNTNTYKQWEDVGSEYISNYGYQHRFGFRCGIAVPFPLFDVFERRRLKLYELPFIIMDTVMYRNQPDLEKITNEIKGIIEVGKKYKAVICVNWHTNVYNMPSMKEYKVLYTKLIEYIKE